MSSLEMFGQDPMDQFSSAISRQEIKAGNANLGVIFTRERRANPEKPGRTLTVGWDAREPLVPGFENLYSYTMRFQVEPGREGVPAGKHYHKEKDEIFQAIVGSFLVVLEDRETKERTELRIDAAAPQETLVYVPAGVAHAVKPLSEGLSALDVKANHPNVKRDEFPYEMSV